MNRVGLFIGVNRTGTLEPLRDASGCAIRMHDWAIAQGGMVDGQTAILITDDDGSAITVDLVKKAIQKLLSVGSVDQLIVYFAGHGVIIRQSEQWLLTNAPDDANAAINLTESAWQARYCSVPHVVFISDACRVAPVGINAQNVAGQNIFKNVTNVPAHPVDVFYATSVGNPAAEAIDPTAVAKEYKALYTEALLEALKQPRLEATEPAPPGENRVYIHPPKLAAHLKQEVLNLIIARNLAGKVIQDPDSILPSAGVVPAVENWLARFDLPLPAPPVAPPPPPGIPLTTRSFSTGLLRSVIEADMANAARKIQDGLTPGRIKVAGNVSPDWQQLADAEMAGVSRVARTADSLRTPFGTDHFETEVGVKVRGRAITDCFASAVQFDLFRPDTVRVQTFNAPSASLLMRFEGGSAALVPVIPGFIAGLSFTDDGLTNITYEPSGPMVPGGESSRYREFSQRAEQIRVLRGVVASMSLHGRFRIKGQDSAKLAMQMQYAKSVDPTLALYAAYAYNDLQLISRITEMSNFLEADIGATFFDIELLGGRLLDRSFDRNADPQWRAKASIVPQFPMLSQGWNLLRPNRIDLPKQLREIESTVQPSLWTLFNSKGGDLLQDAIKNGEI